MAVPHRQNIEVSMPLQAEFLPVATGCVEQSVQVFGLGRSEAMHLTLAVEEVYSFLAARTATSQRLKLLCRNGGYYAEVSCRFPLHALQVGAFNITSAVSSEDEQSLSEMGLLLAARTVDQLGIFAENNEMQIHFVKNKKFQQINASVYSDDRFYTYKFIDRNCTTMVVDKINNTLGSEYIKSQNSNQSYREILYPYMSDFYMKLGIQLIFGAKVDEPATRLFLPYEFKKAISNTKVNGTTIEQSNKTILEARKTDIPFNWLNSIYSLIGVIFLLVILGKKWLKISYLIFTGLLGVFFSLVGLYSLHEEILWNYNILLFNPLLLVFAWHYWKGNRVKIILFGQICLGFLLAYFVYMLNKIHLEIVWPFIALHFYWIGKIVLLSKKTKQS